MKLVSDELGRVVQLFIADEIGPFGGIYIPDLYQLISERYGFVKQSDMAKVLEAGAKFEQGRLKVGEKNINIMDLTIFNDGIVINGRNTVDASAVMDDLLVWGKQAFGLREPETKITRRYISHVVVDFNKPIDNALRGFGAIRRTLSDSYKQVYGADVNYDLFRVSLTVDPQTIPPQTFTEFAIERRVGVPYSKNRFFSVAPLTTQAHLALLEVVEREFGG